MDSFFDLINTYIPEILIGLFILVLVAIIVGIVNLLGTSKMLNKYKQLMKGMDNENLEEMLLKHLRALELSDKKVKELSRDVSSLSREMGFCIQRAAMVRYNPFETMGSNQSFSLALLDKHGHGVVLTGLYSREASTIFAKPLENYKSSYPLSDEEKQAIDMALKTQK